MTLMNFCLEVLYGNYYEAGIVSFEDKKERCS